MKCGKFNSTCIFKLGITLLLDPLFSQKVANASEFAEELFNSKYKQDGTIEWKDSQEPFCEFMRPAGYLNVNFELNTVNVELPHQKSKCRVELLTCVQKRYEGLTSFAERHRYARGPNDKYYEMLPSPNIKGWYVIYQRVWIPDDDYEKSFYNHWKGIETDVKWVSSRSNFCEGRTPDTTKYVSWRVEARSIVLVSQRGVIIRAEVLFCRYKLSGEDETTIVAYTESPVHYYEVREYKFPLGIPKTVFAIFRMTNTAPP